MVRDLWGFPLDCRCHCFCERGSQRPRNCVPFLSDSVANILSRAVKLDRTARSRWALRSWPSPCHWYWGVSEPASQSGVACWKVHSVPRLSTSEIFLRTGVVNHSQRVQMSTFEATDSAYLRHVVGGDYVVTTPDYFELVGGADVPLPRASLIGGPAKRAWRSEARVVDELGHVGGQERQRCPLGQFERPCFRCGGLGVRLGPLPRQGADINARRRERMGVFGSV